MKRLFIKLIRVYQNTPLKMHDYCMHYPTCSNYMIESLNEYGFIKGSFLGFKRILRCRPFGTVGYDPVPKKERIK